MEVPGSCQGDWGLSSKERKELQASMGSHRPVGSCQDDRTEKRVQDQSLEETEESAVESAKAW